MSTQSIAIVVHPLDECYPYLPSKEYIQRELLSERYNRTITIAGNSERFRDQGRRNTVYIDSETVICSPPDERCRESGYNIIDPEELFGSPGLPEGTKVLNISLMGGEVPGCHSGALKDLVNWFRQTSLQELSFYIPFGGVFTGDMTYGAAIEPIVDREYMSRLLNEPGSGYSNYYVGGAQHELSDDSLTITVHNKFSDRG